MRAHPVDAHSILPELREHEFLPITAEVASVDGVGGSHHGNQATTMRQQFFEAALVILKACAHIDDAVHRVPHGTPQDLEPALWPTHDAGVCGLIQIKVVVCGRRVKTRPPAPLEN